MPDWVLTVAVLAMVLGLVTLAFGDVTVDRVIGEVGFSADEPAERRRIRLVDFVPRSEPVQLARSPFPEGDGIASPVFDPALNYRCR